MGALSLLKTLTAAVAVVGAVVVGGGGIVGSAVVEGVFLGGV